MLHLELAALLQASAPTQLCYTLGCLDPSIEFTPIQVLFYKPSKYYRSQGMNANNWALPFRGLVTVAGYTSLKRMCIVDLEVRKLRLDHFYI